jgi:NurA-like 5'-3' nuclease
LTREAIMTKRDLLDIIESLLEGINVLISKSPSEEEKKELDELADELDEAQNKLVKLMIQENDAKYVKITEKLDEVNSQIKDDLTALENLRKILDGFKQAVGLVIEIVKLVGAAAAA